MSPEPHYSDAHVTLHHGDCLNVLRALPDASVDAVVTDPPYGLANHRPDVVTAALVAWAQGDRERVPVGSGGFMGRDWDTFVPPPAVWDECLRVLRPGGHLVAFAGSRTYDLMGLSIRLAGFEVRDGLQWLYSTGFPKGTNVSKNRRFCTCETGPAVPYVHGEDDVRGVRPGVRDLAPDAASGEVADLLPSVQREGARAGVGAARREGLRRQDSGEPSAVRDARRAEPGLEGRGDVQAGEGQLRGPAVCPVPAGPADDGALGRVRDGAPPRDGAVDRSPADADGVREPHRPEPAEQRALEPGAVPDERGPQAGRGRPVCAGCGKPVVAPGLNTSLKPAHEPIVLARKPLAGTVAATVLAHGTGALNIDGCRVGDGGQLRWSQPRGAGQWEGGEFVDHGAAEATAATQGRWPSNVLLGHGEDCADECAPGCPVAELDSQSGTSTSPTSTGRGASRQRSSMEGGVLGAQGRVWAPGDSGGASRFFPSFRYQAKAPARERPKVDGVAHPTCKPLTVMQWLIRLVCPPGGTILEPFAGSGTTVEAAILEGFDVIAVEREAEYLPLIGHRVERANAALAERAATELRRATTEPAPLFDLPA